MSKIVEHRGYLLVEVPEGANDFVLDMGYLIFKVMNPEGWVTDDEIEKDVKRFLTTGRSKFSGDSNLPALWKTSGIPLIKYWKVEIIGLASTLSEKEWEGIVEKHWVIDEIDYYKIYFQVIDDGGSQDIATTSATDSGLSLLARENLKATTTLVLKKIN